MNWRKTSISSITIIVFCMKKTTTKKLVRLVKAKNVAKIIKNGMFSRYRSTWKDVAYTIYYMENLINPPSYRNDTVLPLPMEVRANAGCGCCVQWQPRSDGVSGNRPADRCENFPFRSGSRNQQYRWVSGYRPCFGIKYRWVSKTKPYTATVITPYYGSNKKSCKTKLERNLKTGTIISGNHPEPKKWLKTHQVQTPIIKWETTKWGEVPADFGRKTNNHIIVPPFRRIWLHYRHILSCLPPDFIRSLGAFVPFSTVTGAVSTLISSHSPASRNIDAWAPSFYYQWLYIPII